MSRPSTAALTLLSLAPLVPIAAHAQSVQAASQKPVLTTLHRFDEKHGADPKFTLTPGSDGNFYGMTPNTGVVFKITPGGTYTTLWQFNGKSGYSPTDALVEGKDGAFYGTTEFGGAHQLGTAFRVTSTGQFTRLHSFSGPDGSYPSGALLRAPDGSFYGTTVLGGAGQNMGTVFHMTPAGQVTVLHKFAVTDGEHPVSGVVFGSDGALYGTTPTGGASSKGVVFRMTTDGAAFSVLHSFTGGDGATAMAGLTAGSDNTLYGMTLGGGIGFKNGIGGGGVAYKITQSGMFTLLHKFSEDGHGLYPFAGLTRGADGNFYGTTTSGGTNNQGTVFVMTPAGGVTTLYKFHTPFDGSMPYAGVVFGSDGALYGATYVGGLNNDGTLFKLTLPVVGN